MRATDLELESQRGLTTAELEDRYTSSYITQLKFLREGLEVLEINPFRWLLSKCCVECPGISVNPRVLGGIPHIEGTRLSVGQVLGRLRHLGSIEAVVEYYAPYISEEQVKQALYYAQNFLELVSDPYQAYD
jgi:uncharacterized protein (DUF433 family)